MFDRFTDDARGIMGLAKSEAQRLRHGSIGTEHILLALLQQEHGGATDVLKLLNVDAKPIRSEIEKSLASLPNDLPPHANLPFTQSTKRVLELAVEEARSLGHDCIGSEHLLLGLVKEDEGIAARVLIEHGVSVEAARGGLARLLARERAAGGSSAGARPPSDRIDAPNLKVDRRFSERARKVLELAKAEAQRLDHEGVGTQHILVGLIEEGGGVAATVLRQMNVDLQRVRETLEKIVIRSLGPRRSPGLPFTPRGKSVLEAAAREASQRGSDPVGTEHLLLGLLEEDEGMAARVLLHLGVKLADVRARTLEFAGGERGASVPAAAAAATAATTATVTRLLPPGARIAAHDDVAIAPLRFPVSDLRIGVVGAGGIVKNAHLPAYRKWKLRTTAIVDVVREVAEGAAQEFGIPAVCATVEDLVRRHDVDVLDVAIPEQARAAVLPLLLKAGKPVLLQKPLAYTLEAARRIVADFARAKVPLAVNQNLRWSPEMQAAKQLIAGGHLGRLFDLRWTMRNTSDRRAWAKGSWYSKDERFQVLSWSEHHLDAFRFLLDDEGARVYCALPRRPDQNFTGDVAATAVIHFRNGVHVSMVDSNVATPGRPEEQTLDVDGTGGSLTFGLAKPRTFAYWLAKEIVGDGDAPAHAPTLEGEWYPDGFAGSMATFLHHLRDGSEAPISGRRNLGTMALVDACYRSAASGQSVEVARIDD